MVTANAIDNTYSATNYLTCDKLMFMHSVSCYPLEDKDASISTVDHLAKSGLWETGYSDHTKGIHMAVAAVGMGATMIEKHITLDRTMWGTDQSASLEPDGLRKMVRNIRSVCAGWGDGSLKVRECEKEAIRRLKG
jgi:N-acetylneuraminate synthase